MRVGIASVMKTSNATAPPASSMVTSCQGRAQFSIQASTLLVALVLTSPKRPCLFLSKEMYREAENSEAEQKMKNRRWVYLDWPSIGE